MGLFPWTSAGIGSILRMTVLLIRKKLRNIKRGILYCHMLISRFLLVKQFLFCPANFKNLDLEMSVLLSLSSLQVC